MSQTPRNQYVSATLSSTFNGTGGIPGSASGSYTIQIVRVGRAVTLYIPQIQVTTGTSNTAISAASALPSWAFPAFPSVTYAAMKIPTYPTSPLGVVRV